MTDEASHDAAILPRRRIAWLLAASMGFLTMVAWLAPAFPFTSPYETTANQTIIPGCAEVQCFRVLVPWVIGLMPGPSALKWKTFAVACVAAAGVASFDLALTFGLSRRQAVSTLALTVTGFGAMFAMWDPFNADPLMFFLAPVVTRWLIEERYTRVAWVTVVTVVAKEFVVMVVAMVGVWSGWARRPRAAVEALAIAGVSFVIWGGFQLFLMRRFGYSYSGFGTAPAANLLTGSFLRLWLTLMPARAAIAALANEFGAVYLLAPVGWMRAPRILRQLSIAALPFAAFLAYVEQPDRALWNFHFLALPLASIVLDALPIWGRITFTGLYALANVRAGGQITLAPPVIITLPTSLAIAVLAIVRHLSQPAPTVGNLKAV